MPEAPDFINALCDWIADPDRADLERSAAPFELFAHAATEVGATPGAKNFTDTYTVIRSFSGDAQGNDPTRDRAMQAYTVGKTAKDAMEQAQAVHDALLAKIEEDDDGPTPVRNVALNGWVVIAVGNLREPGLIGVDTKQRAEVSFGFEVAYRPA